jgi:cytoskeletal protein CcmA (bactofilin family)
MGEPERVGMYVDEGKPTSAFLAKGCQIIGKVQLGGPGRIEGEVDGEIIAQDTLYIGEGASVKATITGTVIVVHGQVTGDITAKTSLELRAHSRVTGNIIAPSLVINEGAYFEGQCAMGSKDAPRAADKDKKVSFLGKDAAPQGVPPKIPAEAGK